VHREPGQKLWLSGDQHYGHRNIITYAKRPFTDIEEMNETLISNFNSVVSEKDVTIHAGDFCFGNRSKFVKRLNGRHIFLRGDHDTGQQEIFQTGLNGHWLVICHWPLSVWPRSHYGAFHAYAHCHGRFQNIGKSWDIGVDNNNYFPVSEEQFVGIMKARPNNPNLVKNVPLSKGEESTNI